MVVLRRQSGVQALAEGRDMYVAQSGERGVDAPLWGPRGGKIKAYTEWEGEEEGGRPGLGVREGSSLGRARVPPTWTHLRVHLRVRGLLGGLGTPSLHVPNVQSCGGLISAKIPVRLVREQVLTAVVSGRPGNRFPMRE